MSESPSKLPPFPRPAPEVPVQTMFTNPDFDWEVWEACRRQHMESLLLPFWRGMQAMYAAILADNESNAGDGLTLAATIADWPESFEAQQHALVDLMDKSKLRQSWRSFAHWQNAQMSPITEGQMAVSAALKKEHADNARPMREIPLYSDDFRVACQQVICMPVQQWHAMFTEDVYYEPTSINEAVVEKLAARIARALNDPFAQKPQPCALDPERPWADGRFSKAPERLIVWNSNPGALIGRIDNHGMSDRMLDDFLRPIEHEPDRIPTWRFDGFCGQLRVTGIGDEPWHVTVLAPDHFVYTLTKMVRKNE